MFGTERTAVRRSQIRDRSMVRESPYRRLRWERNPTGNQMSNAFQPRGALPTAMATPTAYCPTAVRSSGDGVRSACCSLAPGSSIPGSLPLLHKLHAAACAVLCGGTQEWCPSLCARGGERIRAAWQYQHGHGALLHGGCVLPGAHLIHCLPAILHGRLCGAHILQRHMPHGCRCRTAAAHAHAPSSTRQ